MPGMPWTPLAVAEPDRDYVVMATKLVLSGYRHIPAFLRSTQGLWPELTGSEGLLGYSLDADPTRRTFHTLSVWHDSDAIAAFVRSEPHALVVAHTRPWLAGSTFRTWTVPGRHLPLNWGHVHQRLRTPPSQPAAAVDPA